MAKFERTGTIHTERTTRITDSSGNKKVIETVSEHDSFRKKNTNISKGISKGIKGIAGGGAGFGKIFLGVGGGIISTLFTALLIVLVVRLLNGQALPTTEGFFRWIANFQWDGIPYIDFDFNEISSSQTLFVKIFGYIGSALSKIVDSLIFLFNLLYGVIGVIARMMGWLLFG